MTLTCVVNTSRATPRRRRRKYFWKDFEIRMPRISHNDSTDPGIKNMKLYNRFRSMYFYANSSMTICDINNIRSFVYRSRPRPAWVCRWRPPRLWATCPQSRSRRKASLARKRHTWCGPHDQSSECEFRPSRSTASNCTHVHRPALSLQRYVDSL